MKKSSAKVRLIAYSITVVLLLGILVFGIMGSYCVGISCGSAIGGYRYNDGDKYSIGQGTLDEEIDSVDIDWIAGNVKMVLTDEAKVIIKETESEDEDNELRYRVVDGKLVIKFRKSGDASWNFWGRHHEKELTVYIPRKMAENMKEVAVSCVSSDLNIKEITACKLNVEMVSGDIKATGIFDDVEIEMVSGDIDMVSDKMLLKADVESVSGDVKLTMPEGDGFTAEHDSVSGDMDIDFEIRTKGKASIYKDGSADYKFESVSGDVSIKKK